MRKRVRFIGVAIGVCVAASGALALAPAKKLLKPKIVAHFVAPRAVPRVATKSPMLAKLKPAGKPSPPAVPAPADLSTPAPESASGAGQPMLLAQAGDWSVFRAAKGGGQTCYSATQPKDTMPRQANRTPVYVYLTGYSQTNSQRDVTISLGQADQPASVTANVDGRDFLLAAKDGFAFPPSLPAQQDFLDAMRHGHTLLLKTEWRGAATITDSFSLLGLDDSLRSITRACSEKADAQLAQ